MDVSMIASFALVALVLVVSPGPNGLLISRTVPLYGCGAGVANVIGFVAAFALHGALSIFGLSVILVQSADLFFVIKSLGALYLIWIGGKALWSLRHLKEREADALVGDVPMDVSVSSAGAQTWRSYAVRFCEGFLTNALNPKVALFYLSAFPQFVPAGEWALPQAIVLLGLHASMNALWFVGMIVILGQMKKAVGQSVRFKRWLNGVTGAVFIGFGVKLMTLRP